MPTISRGRPGSSVCPAHDTWSQAETGAIMIGNYGGVDIRPGALGLPEPGIDAQVVEARDDRPSLAAGSVRPAPAGVPGLLAFRAGFPSLADWLPGRRPAARRRRQLVRHGRHRAVRGRLLGRGAAVVTRASTWTPGYFSRHGARYPPSPPLGFGYQALLYALDRSPAEGGLPRATRFGRLTRPAARA